MPVRKTSLFSLLSGFGLPRFNKAMQAHAPFVHHPAVVGLESGEQSDAMRIPHRRFRMVNTPGTEDAPGTQGSDPLVREFFTREHNRSVGIKRLARRYTPFWMRRFVRAPYLFALDTLDSITGKRNPLVPPRYVNYAGFNGYLEAGQVFAGHLKNLCGLQPSHRVLDVGSGMGRMAVGLSSYLTDGSYEGLDIVPSGVNWCQKKSLYAK